MLKLSFLVFIICISSVSGMDSDSNTSELNIEKSVELGEYADQKLNGDDLYSNVGVIPYELNQQPGEKSGDQILSKDSGETFGDGNNLKRKQHKSIPACEFCQRKSTKYRRSKMNGISLCDSCYGYEYRYDYVVPLDLRDTSTRGKRNRAGKHKSHILVCEYCQEESVKYKTSQFSNQALCASCYWYEVRHRQLVPRDQRKYYGKHKDNILVCEYEHCQKESARYTRGKFSGKSLCKPCYLYEYRHGHLIPPDERENARKYIFVCKICQKESLEYKTGKTNDKSLCEECDRYKSIHDNLTPSDQTNKSKKHNDSKNKQCNRLLDAEKILK